MTSGESRFERAEDPTGAVFIRPEFAGDFASLNLETFDDWMSFNGGAPVDRNRGRSVVKLRLRRTYFLKRFHKPPLKDFLVRWVLLRSAPTHAASEVEAARLLQKAGIGTYEVAAYGEAASGPARKSFLVTANLDGFEALSQVIAASKLAAPRDAAALRKALIPALAALTRRMHLAGITHPDFYTTHVFVRRGGGGPEFRVIDLHRCRAVRSLGRFHAARDLAALHLTSSRPQVTRSDRLRFLREYLGRERLDADVRALAAKITARSERIGVRSKFRNFAPLE